MVEIEILDDVISEEFSYSKGIREVPTPIAKRLISDGLARPTKKVERAVKKRKGVQTKNSSK